ncbi:MAG: ABC transporter ATP-binding protein/permease [Methanobrevibacter sp.]|nr:ABC transporter ATP-binding protein/permease [Candidatus Methanovirga australis]
MIFKNNLVFFFNRFVRKHSVVFIAILLLSVVSYSFTFINPLFFQILIDNIFINKEFQLLNFVILGMFFIFAISAITSYLNSYLMGRLNNSLYREVSQYLFSIILSSSMKNYQSNDTGDLITRVMGNVQLAVGISSSVIPHIFTSIITIILPFIIMLHFNIYLTLITISPGLLFMVLNLYFGKKIEKNQTKFLMIQAKILSILKELISIFPMIKVFNLNTWANDKFRKVNEEYYSTSMGFTKISSANASFNSFVVAIPTILFIIFGGDMVLKGTLSIGIFTAFLSYISMFFAPISQFSSFWNMYKSSTPAIDRIKEIIDKDIKETSYEKLNFKDGTISFEDVDFAYGEKIILKDFNNQFYKGLNYLVGDNGTGKSTIMQLICGILTSDKGKITIDGQNINNIEQKNLFNHISIVFSNPYLFKGSIYENIIVGNLNAEKSDVEEVCNLVELEDFIKNHEEGYDYDVGESGQLLSSGERQKVALARALINKKPILLLDEAMKSIDEETRKTMNSVLKKIQNNKTIIIITHNLSEIEKPSNIIKIPTK